MFGKKVNIMQGQIVATEEIANLISKSKIELGFTVGVDFASGKDKVVTNVTWTHVAIVPDRKKVKK